MRLRCLFAVLSVMPALAQYSVTRDGDVVRLEDRAHRTTVSVLPAVGNMATGMQVNGQDVLFFPADLARFRARPTLAGIPFLAPWANRLEEPSFYANGKKYVFNMDLGNIRGRIPIHGFLSYTSEWKVVEARADDGAAWITSRLEFFRQPAWMAQFPFAHTIEMTYRLAGGVLEVSTRLENVSAEPMPVSIGFHPYFQLTDSLRDDWTIGIGARSEWLLSQQLLPTGETRPIEDRFPNPQQIALRDFSLDNVFGDLVRDRDERAVMSVRGKSQGLDVIFGEKYRAACVYAPRPNPNRGNQNRSFICFEPMAAITNALHLAQRGVYKELQSIRPGEAWQESFWVRPSGF